MICPDGPDRPNLHARTAVLCKADVRRSKALAFRSAVVTSLSASLAVGVLLPCVSVQHHCIATFAMAFLCHALTNWTYPDPQFQMPEASHELWLLTCSWLQFQFACCTNAKAGICPRQKAAPEQILEDDIKFEAAWPQVNKTLDLGESVFLDSTVCLGSVMESASGVGTS